ncbi:hypothetical protein IAU60_001576 [Kwoniella sp. DSM 27419]
MAISDRASTCSSDESLFGPENEEDDTESGLLAVASRVPPDIPGLWVFPSMLPPDTARTALGHLADDDVFSGGTRDQVMLFDPPRHLGARSSLPRHLIDLLAELQGLLETRLDRATLTQLFDQPLARQVILNLYPPGQGISPHIDLPHRYADGILGCSLTGGCVMMLSRDDRRYHVYMPPRTVYILSGEARWEWAHGIEGRESDLVVGSDGAPMTVLRDVRVSITFRWMKEGADVLS